MMGAVPRRAGRFVGWLLRPFAGQEPSFYRAVVACFGIAVTLWLLRALSETYTAPLSCPVRWEYDAGNYRLARPLPAAVVVRVRGAGWRLLSRSLGFHLPVAVVKLRPPQVRPPHRSPLRVALRKALGTVRLVELPADSASYQLLPGPAL